MRCRCTTSRPWLSRTCVGGAYKQQRLRLPAENTQRARGAGFDLKPFFAALFLGPAICQRWADSSRWPRLTSAERARNRSWGSVAPLGGKESSWQGKVLQPLRKCGLLAAVFVVVSVVLSIWSLGPALSEMGSTRAFSSSVSCRGEDTRVLDANEAAPLRAFLGCLAQFRRPLPPSAGRTRPHETDLTKRSAHA